MLHHKHVCTSDGALTATFVSVQPHESKLIKTHALPQENKSSFVRIQFRSAHGTVANYCMLVNLLPPEKCKLNAACSPLLYLFLSPHPTGSIHYCALTVGCGDRERYRRREVRMLPAEKCKLNTGCGVWWQALLHNESDGIWVDCHLHCPLNEDQLL